MSEEFQDRKLPIGILLCGLLYLAAYLGFAWLYHQTFHTVLGDAIGWNSEEGRQIILGMQYLTALYWGFGAFCLAIWRVWPRHPFFQPTYLRWLRSTPWQPRMPLPKGSPMPGAHEAILIVVAAGCLAWILPWLTIAWLVAAYVIVFTVLSSVPYLFYMRKGHDGYPLYAVLILAGLLVLLHRSPWVVVLTSAAIFASACFAMRESLHGMIYYKEKIDGNTEISIGGNFPLSGVEPGPIKPPTAWGEAILISLLLAFWAGIVHHLVSTTAEALLLTSAFILVVPFIRLMCYTSGYRPPITLVQRIKTRRYILANHDAVYIGPAAGLVVGVLVLLVGYALNINAPVTTGLSIFGCLLILFTAGPSRQHWQLTANHRVVPRTKQVVVTS